MPPMDLFKKCPNCLAVWETRDRIIRDPAIELNGYKADFERPEYGLFFFSHLTTDCRSTLAIEVTDFLDLCTGIIHLHHRTDEADCPGYCRDEIQLERCNAICECVFVREILQLINHRDNG